MDLKNQQDLSQSLCATKEQLTCDLDGEAVVLNLKTGVYISLNPMAVSIWEKLQKPTTAGALKEAILAEYEVDPEVCTKDLEAVLNELQTQGLLEPATSSN